MKQRRREQDEPLFIFLVFSTDHCQRQPPQTATNAVRCVSSGLDATVELLQTASDGSVPSSPTSSTTPPPSSYT